VTQLKRCHQRKPGIFELMPRVDVSLMLVVFLLLSSGMVASEDQHVPIDLPVTESGEACEAVSMSLSISAKGAIYLGTRSLALDQLEVVVIRADRKSEHGQVMEVIDELWRFKVGTIFYASDKGPEAW
jgi:biopolymer transport protein ExbD